MAKSLAFARLNEKSRLEVLSCFAEGLTATQASKVLGLNRKTLNKWYSVFRSELARAEERAAPVVIDQANKKYAQFKSAQIAKYYGISRINKHAMSAEIRARYLMKNSLREYLMKLPGIMKLLEL